MEDIEALLLEDMIDLEKLKMFSRRPGGFLNNSLRSRVWPKLMGVNRYDLVDYRAYLDPHRDDSQVRMDVDRSLWSFKNTCNWATAHRENRRAALCGIISAILCRHSQLFYYQGFHDTVSVFLLVLEEDHLAFALAERAALYFFRDCMHKDFHLVAKLTPLLFRIVAKEDAELSSFMQSAGLESFFAISWIITWFAHDVKDLDAVARIYDAMLCSPPCFLLYVSAAYLLHLRTEILECECDFASLHNLLVHAPATFGVPFEALLQRADSLLVSSPPALLARALTTGSSGSSGSSGGNDSRTMSLLRASKVCFFSQQEPLKALSFRGLGRAPADWALLRRQHLKSLRGTQTLRLPPGAAPFSNNSHSDSHSHGEIERSAGGPIDNGQDGHDGQQQQQQQQSVGLDSHGLDRGSEVRWGWRLDCGWTTNYEGEDYVDEGQVWCASSPSRSGSGSASAFADADSIMPRLGFGHSPSPSKVKAKSKSKSKGNKSNKGQGQALSNGGGSRWAIIAASAAVAFAAASVVLGMGMGMGMGGVVGGGKNAGAY